MAVHFVNLVSTLLQLQYREAEMPPEIPKNA